MNITGHVLQLQQEADTSNKHPGKILKKFMNAMEMSSDDLALGIKVPKPRISEILNGKRKITLKYALKLGKILGTDPEFWVKLQADYDIHLMLVVKDVTLGGITIYKK